MNPLFMPETPSFPNAACVGADPEEFFPGGDYGRPTDYSIELAKAMCKACPERVRCLEFALDNKVQGIWGGTTEEERRKKAKKKTLSREERREAVARLALDHSDYEVAQMLKVSRAIVQNDRQALGLIKLPPDLTARRQRVAELHALGLNDREIADRIGSNRDAIRRDRLALRLEENHKHGKATA